MKSSSMWKTLAYVCAGTALMTMAVVAKDVRTISVRDDCDPATFNANVGPGTCVGGGDTTFDEFLGALPDGHDKWRFNNDRTETDLAVNSNNRGGETHTFTEVRKFGGGFIPFLNNPDEDLVSECVALDANGNPTELADGTFVPGAGVNPQTVVPPGGTTPTKTLSRGSHKFQCCIHPWMRSTVTRR
jgi:hypothetical protein